MKNRPSQTIASWILQLIAAVILAQTLFFKFSGAEESKFIFTTLGVEPWGRIASAWIELLAVVLLLIPRTVATGALLALGVMTGAIGSHLTKLGIVVKDDGGLLFGLALTVFVCSAALVMMRRREFPLVGGFLSARDEVSDAPPTRQA
ncbi:MAG: DoxX family protein [Verrucomicrobiales bacterium]|nr:DoxX family protein [Verrucomicrobiales bacterium]